MPYTKTQWVNKQTRLNADNLNHLEGQHDAAIGDVGFVTAYEKVQPSAFRRWQTALALQRAGQRDARLLCIGDSTTAGVGVNPADGSQQGNKGAYPNVLAGLLSSAGLDAVDGLLVPAPDAGNHDVRINMNTWEYARTAGNYRGFADATAAVWRKSSAPSDMEVSPRVTADTIDVYFLTGDAAFGSVRIGASDGQSATVYRINTATATLLSDSPVTDITVVASGIAKVSIALPSLTSAAILYIQAIDAAQGDISIIGFEPRRRDKTQVLIGNAGVGAADASAWALPGQFQSRESIKAYAPDLAIISLGLNDDAGGIAPDQYAAAVRAIVAAVQLTGDVLLVAPVPRTGATDNSYGTPNLDAYVDALRALPFPFVDQLTTWGPGNAPSFQALRADSLHPNRAGYALMASLVAGTPGLV